MDDNGPAEPVPGRRRALFIPDTEEPEDGPGETPLATKPVPQAADMAEREPDSAADEWAGDFDDGGNEAEQSHECEPPQEISDAIEIALPVDASEDEIAPEIAPETAPPTLATGMTAEQLISRPLDELGIVQLVERFALSLQKQPASAFREQEKAREELLADAEFPVPEAMQAADTNEWFPPVAAEFPTEFPPDLPDALRPVEFRLETGNLLDDDDDEEEVEEFSSLLNLRKVGADPRKSVELPDDNDNDVSETVAAFPGADGGPVRRKFDAPVGISAADRPASEEGSAADTERTLRDALAQLQKMSGVG